MPEEPTELNKDARALRMSLGRIARLLREYPHLQSKYERARETMGLFTHPTFYEVTSRCNLRCHGCYYFEGGFDPRREEVTSIEAWDVFFAAEARRGVTMGQYFGGEPALVQDVLRAAVKHIPLGNIGTNGTIRIDPEIQLRIHLSVWGDRKTDASLRGKPVFMQGVKNYAGDPRVVVAYTFNSMNLSEAREIAAICRDHELHMTFNMFTPTHSYQSKVNQGKTDDQACFPGYGQDKLVFSSESLMKARKVVAELMEDFPETILYSREYNDWVTTPGPLFELDPVSGRATNCGSRIKDHFQVFLPDLSKSKEKCCHADINCSECRVYGAGFSSRLSPVTADLGDGEGFEKWLDFVDLVRKIFIYQPAEARPSELTSSEEKANWNN